MTFYFSITEEYLKDYTGKSAFRAKVYYEVIAGKIANDQASISLNCLPHIISPWQLSKDIKAAIYNHAEALIEEDKAFEPEPEYNDAEQKEKQIL